VSFSLLHSRLLLGSVLAALSVGLTPAHADKIKNPTAIFSGLDKITGRIITFEVAVDETVQFGALQLTPRLCYTRPATETPQTTGFVEVDEVTLDSKYRRLFTGWMFAASPGLHGVEHAIYDVWLVDCKGGTEIIKEAVPDELKLTPAVPLEEKPKPRRRPREELPPLNDYNALPIPPANVPSRPPQQPSRRFYPNNSPGYNIPPPDPGR
jgi:hypothetical protein